MREQETTMTHAAPGGPREAEDVPVGYKRTDVGVIPEDWEPKTIHDIAPLQRGFDLPASQIRTGVHPVVYSNGILEHHSDALVKGPGVVTGRSGTIGKVHFVEPDYWPHNTSLWVTSYRGNDPKFVYYLYFHIDFARFLAGSGVPTLNRNDIHKHRVPVPPSYEQRCIAEALSDVDGLLEALYTLIAKKRAIKRTAMQQLLTGKIRLPGFGGKWKTQPLGQFAWIRNQKIVPLDVHGDTICVELDHIGQGDGRLLNQSVARDFTSTKYRFLAGDVLFGRLRSYLRKYWHANQDGICTTEIWPLTVDPQQADSGFLYVVVQSDRFIAAASISYGTHMPRSDWSVVRNFQVDLPPLLEQRAIAAVLSDMDAEIAALEQRRDKTRAIKQGMMQQLLTGRVRLVETGASSTLGKPVGEPRSPRRKRYSTEKVPPGVATRRSGGAAS